MKDNTTMNRTFTQPLFVAFSLLLTLPVLAQRKLTEGTILYDISINNSTGKPQNAEFLDGATNAVFIKGGKVRTEMVSSLGTQSTIIDQASGNKQVTILKEYGPQKFMINLSAADWADLNSKYENVTFTYNPSETKSIQGYTAKKATGKLADGTTFTVWYTPEIVVDNKDFQYANRNLPGLALEYETNVGNLKVVYTVSKLSFAPVPQAKFDLPKSGFRVMTYQESKGGK
jgi:GLPGLI family protein